MLASTWHMVISVSIVRAIRHGWRFTLNYLNVTNSAKVYLDEGKRSNVPALLVAAFIPLERRCLYIYNMFILICFQFCVNILLL